MSSHPGTTMKDAVEMAVWLKKWGYMPEQVQDFYPTPGTISTVMYYTGIHPMTGKSVAVTTDYREKLLQRALLQYSKPENANLVREALKLAGREDLIGNTPDCLVRPAFMQGGARFVPDKPKNGKRTSAERNGAKKASADRRNAGARKAFSDGMGGTAFNGKGAAGAKKTKFDRIFGEDADRIRREAMRLSSDRGSAGKNAGKSAGKGTAKSDGKAMGKAIGAGSLGKAAQKSAKSPKSAAKNGKKAKR